MKKTWRPTIAGHVRRPAARPAQLEDYRAKAPKPDTSGGPSASIGKTGDVLSLDEKRVSTTRPVRNALRRVWRDEKWVMEAWTYPYPVLTRKEVEPDVLAALDRYVAGSTKRTGVAWVVTRLSTTGPGRYCARLDGPEGRKLLIFWRDVEPRWRVSHVEPWDLFRRWRRNTP